MTTSNRNDDTVEMKNDGGQLFGLDDPSMDVAIAAGSHVGKKRQRNEDHYAIVERTRSSRVLDSNLTNPVAASHELKAYGILVADGIGGALYGDYASQLAIETILQSANLATSWLMRFGETDQHESKQRVQAYIDRIQSAFKEHRGDDAEPIPMGTTLTVAYIMAPHVILSHIGDSRAYLYRDAQLFQLTRDHTLAQELLDRGLEPEQVVQYGHVLVNSLGMSQNPVDAEVRHLKLTDGDRLILCSDGLSDLVDPQPLATTLASGTAQVACDRLIQMALDAGGNDNITVVVADFNNAAG